MTRIPPTNNNVPVRPTVEGAGEPRAFDPSSNLPQLHESDLDWDAVDCVLADLDDFAACIEILGRDDAGKSAIFNNMVAARDSLVDGTSQAIQVMYQFADQVWIDTLLRQPGGARLLRMADATRSSCE